MMPACIIVIRRELPLTKYAGPVGIDLSHRKNEDSPFRVPCDLCPQCPTLMASLLSKRCISYAALLPSAPARAQR